MYVDESGDTGRLLGSSSHFCLSALVVHESKWRPLIDSLAAYRRVLRDNYRLPIRAEIHAAEYIRNAQFGIAKHQRLAILRNLIDELAKLDFISFTNICIDKGNKPSDYDVLQAAWGTLFQRFENTLTHGNFPGGHKDAHGMVVTDADPGKKLTQLVRKMAVYNPVPNGQSYGVGYRNLPISRVIEDPSGRDSKQSLPIQACDVVAYFLSQSVRPNSYIKRQRATRYFRRLKPVLNLKASRNDVLGVVRL